MKIDSAKLSPKLRSRIGEATSGPELSTDFFVHPTESRGGKIFAIILGACGVGLVAFAGVSRFAPASGRYWMTPEILMGLGCSFFSAWLVVSQVIRLRGLKRSEIKPAIIASPILIGRSGLDGEPIELHYLRDLVHPNITHHHTNGSYTHTAVSLRFNDGTLSFDIRSRPTADRFLAFLKGTPDALQRWHQAGELAQKVEDLDWIQGFALQAAKDLEEEEGRAGDPSKPRVRARPKYSSDVRPALAPSVPAWERPLLTTKGRMVGALAVAAFVTTASYGANLFAVDQRMWSYASSANQPDRFRDYLRLAPLKSHAAEATIRLDDRSFELAVESKAASPLRAYRKDFPNGRHGSEAKEAVQKIYLAAEEQYRSHTEKAEPHAAEGMKALFHYMREEDAPQVSICFLPGEGIDGKSLEAATKKATGSSRIHGVSGSFNEQSNRGREDRIVAIMTESFKKVLPQELFDLKKANTGEPGPRFLVRYTVKGTGSFYTTESEESLPIESRQIWIGIVIDFDFSLQVPGSKYPPTEDPEKGYQFEMTARPAPNFDVRENASPTEVYDRMVATAFDQFQVNLANAYGLELTMPASWGQLDGLARRPRIPKAADLFGGQNRALDDLAMAVISAPLADKQTPQALSLALSKRARAKGLQPSPAELSKALENARIRKVLGGLEKKSPSAR